MSKKAIVFFDRSVTPLAEIADLFNQMLLELEMEVTLCDDFAAFTDFESLTGYDLIVPSLMVIEPMDAFSSGICNAVESGVGIVGVHGACSCFAEDFNWRFMMGGSFMAHPGNGETEFEISIAPTDPTGITENIQNFTVREEQFYLHIDPAVKVLASSNFPVAPGPHTTNGDTVMPLAWTKKFGAGRMFYCSLGHERAVFEAIPEFKLMVKRGLNWAAR